MPFAHLSRQCCFGMTSGWQFCAGIENSLISAAALEPDARCDACLQLMR
jgi:hypothetical protein